MQVDYTKTGLGQRTTTKKVDWFFARLTGCGHGLWCANCGISPNRRIQSAVFLSSSCESADLPRQAKVGHRITAIFNPSNPKTGDTRAILITGRSLAGGAGAGSTRRLSNSESYLHLSRACLGKPSSFSSKQLLDSVECCSPCICSEPAFENYDFFHLRSLYHFSGLGFCDKSINACAVWWAYVPSLSWQTKLPWYGFTIVLSLNCSWILQ